MRIYKKPDISTLTSKCIDFTLAYGGDRYLTLTSRNANIFQMKEVLSVLYKEALNMALII